MLSPYIVAAQATPILALAPLIALWFGTGLGSRVLICALICFFPIAVGTMVGIRSVDPRLIELGRSLRATRWQRLARIEVPSALPQILGSLRIGVTLAVVGAIVAEWAGGDRGLGVLINLARGSMFDIPLMFATLLTIAMLGVALYLIVVAIERRLVRTTRDPPKGGPDTMSCIHPSVRTAIARGFAPCSRARRSRHRPPPARPSPRQPTPSRRS